MKSRIWPGVLFLFSPALLLAALLCGFHPVEVSGQGGESAFIAVSEIEPGMKGYGLSVFRGETPERFEVEVIDVVPNFAGTQSIILVRCGGQNLENTKIVAGMSGSPVWIEGRLAGAVAYGWAYSRDSVTGITPIHDMMDTITSPYYFRREGVATGFPSWGYLQPEETLVAKSSATDLVPLSTPVMMSGFSPRVIEMLRKELEPYNLVPMAGGGAAGGVDLDREAAAALTPGSAVGGALVMGDLSMVAVGTMTWREGNKIVAFGHPFLQGGLISMPLVSARIHTVISAQNRSFKLGSPVAVVGELFSDRLPAVAGELYKQPSTIPFRLNIENPGTGFKKSYNLHLAATEVLTPLLVRAGMMELISSAVPSLDPTTARVRTRLWLRGYGEATYEDVYAVARGNFNQGYLDPVFFFASNPFEKLSFEKFEVDLAITDDLEIALIDSMWAETDQVRPGSTLTVVVSLKPYGKDPEQIKIQIPVPDDPRVKNLVIVASAGGNTPPDSAMPKSVPDMIAFLDKVHKSNQVVVGYKMPGGGVDVGGTRLDSLPPSVTSMFLAGNSTNAWPAGGMVRVVRDTPFVVMGAQRIKVSIDRP